MILRKVMTRPSVQLLMVISFFLCCRHLASPQSAAADGSVGEGGSVEGGGLMRERGLSTERRLFAPPTEQWLWVEELRNYHALQPIGFAGYPEDVKSGDVKRGDVKRGDLRRGDVKRRDIKPTDLKMANLSRGSSVGSSVDVCIVLTVFSTASYLNQTLTSLMAQSYRGTYRIVAVDDHSEDGSAAILREWASMHRGIITLISLPFRTSGGTAAPANLAICSCMEMGARWLTFTDGDDLTEKDFIEVIPALPRPTLPHPTLPHPTLPRPTLPCPTLPRPTLPRPSLPRPTLPRPTLPRPTLSRPTLSRPTLPRPTLPTPPQPLPHPLP